MARLESRCELLLKIASFVIVFVWYPNSELFAANIGRLLRQLGRVADDVPIRNLDEIAESRLAASKGRELLERAGRAEYDDFGKLAGKAQRAWADVLQGLPPGVIKEVESLPVDRQLAILPLARGAKVVGTQVGDLALRNRLLREGGAELLSAVGRYEDLAEDAIRFDAALRGGRLLSPAGSPPVTLADFGRFFHEHGDRARNFWVKYVRPHWQLWLGGTALTALLLAPDEYIDGLGNLTRAGLEKIGKTGGKALAAVLSGVAQGAVEGTGQALRGTMSSIARTVIANVWNFLATILLGTLMLLAVRPIRKRIFKLWSRLIGRNCEGKSVAVSQSSHKEKGISREQQR